MFNPADIAQLRARTWLNNQITGRPIHTGTMAVRDFALNNIFKGKPEYKRFAQYLTGGVKDDVITELSPEVKAKIVEAHNKGQYRDREWGFYDLNKDGELEYHDKTINYDGTKNDWVTKPKSTEHLQLYTDYNPNKPYTALSAAQNQLGNIDSFTPTGDGGFLLKDKYSVTPDEYGDTWNRVHDLQEGGPVAAWLYRAAKALGTNRDFRYEVPFSKEEMQQYSQP